MIINFILNFILKFIKVNYFKIYSIFIDFLIIFEFYQYIDYFFTMIIIFNINFIMLNYIYIGKISILVLIF